MLQCSTRISRLTMQLADDLPLLHNQGLLLSAGLIPRILISFYHVSQFIPIVVLSHSDIVLNLYKFCHLCPFPARTKRQTDGNNGPC